MPLIPICACPGERQFRYRTTTKGKVSLVCTKCGKPESAEPQFQFKPEGVPA